eukprot:228087_1
MWSHILNIFKLITNLYDLITDIVFIFTLLDSEENYDLFLAASIILSVSTSINFCCSIGILISLLEVMEDEDTDCCLIAFKLVFVFPLSCFIPVDVLHKMCTPKDDMRYSDGDDNDPLRVICINTCCLENIPQIIINCIYVTRIGQWKVINILNVIGSILSIVWDLGCRWYTCQMYMIEDDCNERG